ncbi:hypothetical protein F2Q70_00044631 [Brassica cretica]|uniref:Uncharacterized protein n=1 Tax=Brassica cretica TaxID=69181 RepID=A0A8S9KJA7_BRACR|nr:hypothetical protein F2Q70_00044631 [Brassica cretica]KAF2608998.1 hypothetical protein F2Q68_00045582 [Brassica cretica]
MAKDHVSSVLKSLFLLLLVFLSQHHADSASIVEFLPGFEGPLPFELETGYIGVGEEEEVQLFYYFIKSERNPEKDPLLLWLSGGPGYSSIYGLLFENGPVTIKHEVYNGTLPSLISTTYSWTKMSSIIFLDQPVGTGFSFSTQRVDTPPSDSGEARRIYEFLQKWLGKHEEYIPNPFYVGGDSYSGKVVDALVQEISKGINMMDDTCNHQCCKSPINLQGYMLGNLLTEFETDINHRIPYAREMALISDELYESMKKICGGRYVNVDPNNTECLKLVEEYNKCTETVKLYLISEPLCETETPDCSIYRYLLATYWANAESVRKALQIYKGSIGKWVQCKYGIPYTQDIISSVPYHMTNSISGYRSLIFREVHGHTAEYKPEESFIMFQRWISGQPLGDHDMAIPYLGTQAWIISLNYSVIEDKRPWMINNQLAGEVVIQQSINQTKALSCFNGG